MLQIYISLVIIFAFIELKRLDTSHPWYTPPAINKATGKQSTETQAFIGRVIGDALLLGAIFGIINGLRIIL